jgi:hypothetical protein
MPTFTEEYTSWNDVMHNQRVNLLGGSGKPGIAVVPIAPVGDGGHITFSPKLLTESKKSSASTFSPRLAVSLLALRSPGEAPLPIAIGELFTGCNTRPISSSRIGKKAREKFACK